MLGLVVSLESGGVNVRSGSKPGGVVYLLMLGLVVSLAWLWCLFVNVRSGSKPGGVYLLMLVSLELRCLVFTVRKRQGQ